MAQKVAVPVVVAQTPEEKEADRKDIATWRKYLLVAAAVFLALTLVLQVWNSLQSTKVVKETQAAGAAKDGKPATSKKQTTTTTKGPPDTLVATALGASAALVIAAAFYGRIKKFSFGGAELEFGAEPTEHEKKTTKTKAQRIAAAVNEPGRAPELERLALDLLPTKRAPGLSSDEVADLAVTAASEHLNLL